MFSFMNKYRKLTLFILVLLTWGSYNVYKLAVKIPNALDCTYQAWWIDDMQGEDWTFNWTGRNFAEQCKRKRADGMWVPYGNATDVGMEEIE